MRFDDSGRSLCLFTVGTGSLFDIGAHANRASEVRVKSLGGERELILARHPEAVGVVDLQENFPPGCSARSNLLSQLSTFANSIGGSAYHEIFVNHE